MGPRGVACAIAPKPNISQSTPAAEKQQRNSGILSKASIHRAQFRRFRFEQSKSFPQMVELIAQLKAPHGLKTVAVSYEARDLVSFGLTNDHGVIRETHSSAHPGD